MNSVLMGRPETAPMIARLAELVKKTLVFVSYRETADNIVDELTARGVKVVSSRTSLDLGVQLEEFEQLDSGVLLVSTALFSGWHTKADATVFAECNIVLSSPKYIQIRARNENYYPLPMFINCDLKAA